MPRKARRKSESGIYHIIMRGIDRQPIFKEDEDYHRFLQTLKYYKDTCGYGLFAYCLMNNHAHLLVKVGPEPLEQIMRRICGKYVYWYNRKYERIGYLFQDRFKSEPVEDDAYFLTALRYIHQNPLKAGLVKDIGEYRWSSFNAYKQGSNLVDTDFALNMFAKDSSKALSAFTRYNKQHSEDRCLDLEDKKGLTDDAAKAVIEDIIKTKDMSAIQTMDRATRDNLLQQLKQKGLTIRQIERLTGINRGVIMKARQALAED